MDGVGPAPGQHHVRAASTSSASATSGVPTAGSGRSRTSAGSEPPLPRHRISRTGPQLRLRSLRVIHARPPPARLFSPPRSEHGRPLRATFGVPATLWLSKSGGGAGLIGTRFPEVLEAARGGDEAAFAAIWRDLHPALLRYLRVLTGNAAEDVASETWAAVATSLDNFVGTEPAFRAWLFTVARRRSVDYFRREARRPAVPVDPGSLGTIPCQGADVDPAEMAIAAMGYRVGARVDRGTPTRAGRGRRAPGDRGPRRRPRGHDHAETTGGGAGPGPPRPPRARPSHHREGTSLRNALRPHGALLLTMFRFPDSRPDPPLDDALRAPARRHPDR